MSGCSWNGVAVAVLNSGLMLEGNVTKTRARVRRLGRKGGRSRASQLSVAAQPRAALERALGHKGPPWGQERARGAVGGGAVMVEPIF